MRKQLTMFTFLVFFSIGSMAVAQEKQAADADPNDEKVIAVLEILELMEMMEDIAMFEDMEYLSEGDPNEPKN